jgi:transglutaminase-like putative cysteine protease
MVYRFSWIAGVAGIGLALARAERLLRSSVEGLPWEVILVTAAILGATITWAGISYRLSGWSIAAINTAAAVLAVIRIAVPSTTWFIFPTLDSFAALGDEMSFARDVIGTGVAPVIPLSGIIAILAVVFWSLGGLLSWGLSRHRPYVAVLAPLIVYLEFAIMDRRPSGIWTTVFMVFIGGALLAVAFDRRRESTGLLTSGTTRMALVRSLPSIAVVSLVAALFVAVLTANAVSDLVPRSGYLEWRTSSGLSGEYYGSVSYNPFVGIRQSLVSQTNVPVFVADVQGDIPANQVYWRMVTLDTYDGSQWHVGGEPTIDRPEEIDTFEIEEQAFSGPTTPIISDITVLALQMDWLPAPYSPTAMSAPNTAVDRGYRVKTDDAALRFDALTYRGMSYVVASDVPQPDLDVLSRTADGTPSVVFAGAISESAFEATPATIVPEPRELEDAERFLGLPDEIDGRIGALASSTTRGLQTDFEKAIALEAFFRTPGNFVYSTAVVPGHGASDLADWLLDPTSDNYRVGYCEQFSLSMAVMARMLDIPSRVVMGFTPGTLLEDGRVVVRDRNAHAWVELWMPTQGWVRFDPTPRGDGVNPATLGNLPFDVAQYLDIPEPEAIPFELDSAGGVLFRDEEALDIPERIAATDGGSDSVAIPLLPSWLIPVGVVVATLFGFLPALKWVRRRRRMRRLEDGDIGAAWQEIVDRLTDLGDGPIPSATPAEFAQRTDPAMRPLADVYGASFYGVIHGDAHSISVAARSLEDTEDRIMSRYPLGHRIIARYRLATLIPRWMRKRRR